MVASSLFLLFGILFVFSIFLFIATMFFAGYSLVRSLFSLLSLLISERIPGLIWFDPVYLVTTAGFIADQLIM